MSSFSFIEGVRLSQMCDYSFGDQSSIICGVYGGYMKLANVSNIEFVNKVHEISKERSYMTLFIDNVRLYKREILVSNPHDQKWINDLMNSNDLLELCSKFMNMRFIIFTSLEDTPIDNQIHGKIPNNVLCIHCVNSIYHDDKVIPFPYGLQRKLNIGDNRIDILSNIINIDIEPSNFLYINHNASTNNYERGNISSFFVDKKWASVDSRVDYDRFLRRIKEHKFMICPIGNAIDCHRNWEVLYLRRVPVMKKNDYLEFLFRDFPVLFVDDYSEVTEDLLIKSDHLYNDALNMDMDKLNLYKIFNKIIKENI